MNARRDAVTDSAPNRALRGLSEEEAKHRLLADGPNELPQATDRKLWAIAWEVVREPMFVMLVSAGALYAAMGEMGDAAMLMGSVLVVMAITIVQERRTERALEALRDLSAPRARVLRDGVRISTEARLLVRGDMVILAEGDRVPADGVLRDSTSLSADESLLTGESVPVRKRASASAHEMVRPGGEDLPCLYAGTLVTQGQGLYEVLATGPRAEIGAIGEALANAKESPSHLQQETSRLVRIWASAGVVACLAVVVLYAFTRGGSLAVWKQGALAGIAMAMALLPEEFPVILTVFLALGAWRLSRSHVLTRRMPAVEMLGAATVLCVDKTGTLTENRMGLRALATAGHRVDLDGAATELPTEQAALLECAVLASKPKAFDPMDRALHDAEAKILPSQMKARSGWSLVHEYPLSPEQLSVSQVWRTPQGAHRVACKGAPEAVAALCHLPEVRRKELLHEVAGLATSGLRVLGVARGIMPDANVPKAQTELPLEWLGLLGFEDPVRASVPSAVSECQKAGVRVVMITGDYTLTAQSIAAQAGITQAEALLSGPELAALSDEALGARIRDVGVFARVTPDQKLRIVNALKAQHEVVAMTGDGVNDAPALKSAHIGIAMGKRGTDVAREAAALVLEDDEFASIVRAIALGRQIYDNIKKAVIFTVAVHVPVAALSVIPVFSKDWPLLLLPVHIVFLELIIDPSCSLIFESETAETDAMAHPPRPVDERLFSARVVGIAVLQGLGVLVACLAVFLLARATQSHDAARAQMFVTLVVGFVGMILVNRSWARSAFSMLWAPNQALRWVLGGTTVFLSLALTVPFARHLFHFAPVGAVDVLRSVALGLCSVLWYEIYKWWHKRRAAA